MKNIITILFLLLCTNLLAQVLKPGEVWLDTDDVPINAHGGGVLYHKGTYYWYGTYMHEETSAALKGVSVYSSKDLYRWENKKIALSVEPEGSGHKIESGCLIERPKVIYNEQTGKFVMWFHLELKGRGYSAAEYGVAISDNPTGPFQFLHAGRAYSGIWPVNMIQQEREGVLGMKEPTRRTPEFMPAVVNGWFMFRDLGTGQMVRDMTLFVDEDNKGYHIFSSEENQTLHIAELSDDYCGYTGRYVRILPGKANEAPAIFKRNGKYWLITSGCTGWAANPARLAVSESIWGSWSELPNPCIGDRANKTFESQSTFILPVIGKKDTWIFMADRWNDKNLMDSRYIWLPIKFENEKPVLQWYDTWKY